MNIELFYSEIMQTIAPMLVLGGMLALTIALIVMLINMLINAATGRGFKL